MKSFFGEKAIKLSIDGGFTCPNRDGTIGSRGCIFCSERGSGDFNSDSFKSISEQINEQRQIMSRKWKSSTFIAYFQSYTNTYDTVENLRKKFYEALNCENIKGIAIATRPDCISEEVLELLAELNEKTFLWVELGLQTINNNTANLIRRGYSLDVFEKTAKMLKTKNIRTVIHLIMGLPGE
ncbi:MAG: radical protein, partial [Sedimentibacter sp.]|nr:radical protein [Sedimentibacter sp.]